MTINFPKFPNDRRDKNRPQANDLTRNTNFESVQDVDNNLTHDLSHQEMLTQIDQLDEIQVAQLNAKLKPTISQKTKSLPLMPLVLGIILLAGGGAMGYMYQEYNRPTATVVAPVTVVKPAPTPVTAPANPSPGANSSVTTAPSPPVTAVIPPPTTKTISPALPAASENSITAVTISAPTAVTPTSTEATNSPPIANIPPAASKPPIPNPSAAPPDPQPTTTSPPSQATQNLKSAKASYEDFVKSSENTVFIEPPPSKK